MPAKCTVYIDEAGDLGINRGTQWFVLTAVIINKDSESHMRNILKAIKKDLNLDNIHFRKLRNFEQRAYVVNKICDSDFDYINIILDTSKLNLHKFVNKKKKNPRHDYHMSSMLVTSPSCYPAAFFLCNIIIRYIYLYVNKHLFYFHCVIFAHPRHALGT